MLNRTIRYITLSLSVLTLAANAFAAPSWTGNRILTAAETGLSADRQLTVTLRQSSVIPATVKSYRHTVTGEDGGAEYDVCVTEVRALLGQAQARLAGPQGAVSKSNDLWITARFEAEANKYTPDCLLVSSGEMIGFKVESASGLFRNLVTARRIMTLKLFPAADRMNAWARLTRNEAGEWMVSNVDPATLVKAHRAVSQDADGNGVDFEIDVRGAAGAKKRIRGSF
ncbi:MAG: hypothetical protein AB7P04_01940 [Bacteriovoracia bacterium]